MKNVALKRKKIFDLPRLAVVCREHSTPYLELSDFAHKITTKPKRNLRLGFAFVIRYN
jgi:hypothetical protein